MNEPQKPPYFHPNTPAGRCPHCLGPMPDERRAATSRYDNRTKVCSTCGTAEAMMAAGGLIDDATFAKIMLATQHEEANHPTDPSPGLDGPG